jgi:signal transduction histidine kinase
MIALVTSSALMGLFAAGNYWVTETRLVTQKRGMWEHFQRRLGEPIATSMWTFDRGGLRITLNSELDDTILGIVVLDPAGRLFETAGRFPRSGANESMPTDTEILLMDLPSVSGSPVGQVRVLWSDTSLRSALRTTLWMSIAQIIIVNLMLLAFLWVEVNRMIFRRLQILQDALDFAASRNSAEEISAVPLTSQDEFGAITKSINTITSRLAAELATGKRAEEEVRATLTELQNAQEGLIHAEKMASLGRLVAGVAHELNTPLGNIVTVASAQKDNSQLLSKAVEGGKLTRSGLQEYSDNIALGADLMLTSSRRAAELIQNFKQIAVDQTTDQLRTFDLARHISEVLLILEHVVAKTPIKIATNFEAGIAMRSFPGPLGQVITNLVMNSILHGFNGARPGTIDISCARDGSRAKILVRDNGNGIAPENLLKIFDPFFTTKLGQGGTGLGLHIVHNIVYGLLGGRIDVQSTNGKETSFTVTIPCHAAQHDPRPTVDSVAHD